MQENVALGVIHFLYDKVVSSECRPMGVLKALHDSVARQVPYGFCFEEFPRSSDLQIYEFSAAWQFGIAVFSPWWLMLSFAFLQIHSTNSHTEDTVTYRE